MSNKPNPSAAPLTAAEIFRSMTPYQVIEDLGLPIVQRKGESFTPYPGFPHFEMLIGARELVSKAPNAPTPACGPFDFLALHLGSYEAAVNHAMNLYPDLAQFPLGVSRETLRDQLINDLRTGRKQFEAILALRNEWSSNASGLPGPLSWCGNHRYSVKFGWMMFYAAKGKQLNPLCQYATKAIPSFAEEDSFIVIPYLKNRHTFSFLTILDAGGRFVRTLVLNPCRFAYFGLHSCAPDTQTTLAYARWEDALSAYSQAAESGRFLTGCVHADIDPTREERGELIPEATLVVSPATDFSTIVKTRSICSRCFVSSPGESIEGEFPRAKIPWADFAVQRIIKALVEDDQYSPRVATMVDRVKDESKLLTQLVDFLKSKGEKRLADRIQKQTEPRRLYLVGGTRIEATAEGYVARNSASAPPRPLTNFVINLTENVWFDDLPEMFYAGNLRCRGRYDPIMLSSSQLTQMEKVSKAAIFAYAPGVDEVIGVPVILDNGLNHKLKQVLAQQTANLPRRPGVYRLGWNRAKTSFATPSWKASAAGIEVTRTLMHPRAELVADNYSWRQYSAADTLDQMPAQARYLLAILVSVLTRAFLGYAVQPVLVVRSLNMIELLGAIFAPLGQREPIGLSGQKRKIMDLWGRNFAADYPLYAVTCNSALVRRLALPIFLLADKGIVCQSKIEQSAWEQIAGLSQKIVSALMLYLARNRVVAQVLIQKSEWPEEPVLATEGKKIIEQVCGVEPFEVFAADLPRLEAVLERTLPDKINDVFRYDTALNQVFIRCRTLPIATSRKSLYRELVRKNDAVRLHGTHYISCPPVWFNGVLRTFYGQEVKLEDQRDNADPTISITNA